MTARLWQSTMIGLARSRRVTRFMQTSRATASVRRRYIEVGDAAAAAARAQSLLADQGLRASLFFLGEYVDDPALVDANVAAKHAAARALGAAGLDVHVSVDLTQVGHVLDPDLARRHLEDIAEAVAAAAGARPGVHALMLDMEDRAVVDVTIALHDAMRQQGLPIALTLQANLERTADDLAAQVHAGARVRLVKGAFPEPRAGTFKGRAAIKASHRRLIERMFAADARDAGFYPIIATHDEALIAHAQACAHRMGWTPGTYEFEMLLGVREALAQRLAHEGERVRLYLPFGQDWWPYTARRIGETPANALLLARSLVG